MQEIRETSDTQPRQHTAISTFSGGGGSSLGYRMAHFKVLWANEFIAEAQHTYLANHPDTKLDRRDIRQIDPLEVLQEVGLGVGDLDLLDGSPPCASFSVSGLVSEAWGRQKIYSGKRQRTDDLFFEYIRFVDAMQPKIFIAENVQGMARGAAKGHFKMVMEALRACGYKVAVRELNAAQLGVPQVRRRLIFAGVRRDLGHEPCLPRPFPYYYTVREVLPHITQVKNGGKPHNWSHSNKPSPTICQSDHNTSINAYKSSGGFITTNEGEIRRMTIEEVRVLCSFPSDFVFTGRFRHQWERMGRAVPPLMMRAIARAQCDLLDKVAEGVPIKVEYV
tara:strand:- start:19856 stop:20860 length:1005 start_codon:yes stop_codon:yes gene_type:complete